MNAANRQRHNPPRTLHRQVSARLQPYSVKPGAMDADGNVINQAIAMTAVYTPNPDDPNYIFSKSTPSANLTMWVTNDSIFDFFKEGKIYAVTFEEL